ncbi:MAG: hypothetical protein KGJ59_08415 [Bacteroidota bacterium]|nr:hypothetical protein [Bacteroidota bacterium]
MNTRLGSICVVFLLLVSCGASSAQQDSAKAKWFKHYYSGRYLDQVLQGKHFNYVPPLGVIPDSMTAINVGTLILSKVYGDSLIESEKPFTAVFSRGYWVVYGSLGDNMVGGVAEIVIDKSSGEVKNISHGK